MKTASMKSFRLNRFFNPDSNRCLGVAVDQGLNGERGLLQGIENVERAIQVLALAGPDMVQLSPGQAPVLQGIPGRNKPVLALRVDVPNFHALSPAEALSNRVIEEAVEQALRLDAACIVASLFGLPACPAITSQCVENIVKLKPVCDRWAMPLMVEPLVFQTLDKAGGHVPDGDPDKVLPLVRLATELGADLIQAEGTDDIGGYRKIIEIARVPVLVRGGGRAPDREMLERTEQLIAQGASGIVFGLNIIQHPDPAGMTRALMAIVHERTRALEAARFIRS